MHTHVLGLNVTGQEKSPPPLVAGTSKFYLYYAGPVSISNFSCDDVWLQTQDSSGDRIVHTEFETTCD